MLWTPFGLEALDGKSVEDRKWMTKSFSQQESLLPPHGGKLDNGGDQKISSFIEPNTSMSPAAKKLISDITKSLDVLSCNDASALIKTAELFVTQRPEGAALPVRPPPRREHDEKTVRVSNLADTVTEADLELLFNRVGDVQRAFLVRSHETQQSRGFGFVSFKTKADAQRAIEMLHNKGLEGCVLTVETATRRE